MSLPENITKDHLIQAISKIDTEGLPNDGASQYYDVVYKGNKYPPKLVVSYANIFANGFELDRNTFKGGLGTPCFKLLEREGFIIDKKNTMQNIKLYDIHGASTIENYRTLITPDYKYFYWDSKRFTRNEIGDIVFWVNRTERVVLFTKIDSKEVRPSFKDGKNLINDQGYNVSATAQDPTQFETFYRFKIIAKAPMLEGWNYSNLVPFNSRTMAIILYEPNVNEPEKKIEKINDLIQVFINNEEVTEVLNEALALLQGNKAGKNQKSAPSKSAKKSSTPNNLNNLIVDFCQHLESKKLHFSREIVSRYICSLIAKPFVILTGNSGTGKTKIAIEFAEWISSNENQYNIIPVGADWTDNRPVIGYINPLHTPPIYNSTSILDLILKAEKDKTNPYFLILDEMNLSHVERYFSDFLSAMESEKAIPLHKHGNDILDTANIKIEKSITLPSNLFITGTVNVDETTYMFSPKVLDRANVIEIKAQEEGLSNFPNNSAENSPDGKKYCNYFINESNNSKDQAKFTAIKNFENLKSALLDVFCIMEKYDLEFGFRTMKESYQYASANKELDNKKSLEAQLDEIIIQRILPKLNGSRSKLEKLLIGLIEVCKKDFEREKTLEYIDNSMNIRNYKLDDIKIDSIRFKLSYQKLSKMHAKLKSDQFVSFI
jgi:5-methylcytosine-specific restriction protein B